MYDCLYPKLFWTINHMLHIFTCNNDLCTGLDVCEQFMDVNDMIRDEDLMVHKLNPPGNGVAQFYTSRPGHNVQQLVANMVPNFKSRRPSARELNLLKRKSKINSKDQTKGCSKDGEPEVSYSQDIASPKGFCPDMSNSNKVLMEYHPLFLIILHLELRGATSAGDSC